MCAIIGQLGGEIDKAAFEAARDRMSHRGPDDAGVFYDQTAPLALGNRRLAIIDLSPAGHQPMISADGRYVISFNGEIFNYLELRKELESRYVFRTRSDTEVLIAAYSVWGVAALQKLNGQFAFAIWDAEKKELVLGRDHFGVKPLFYSNEGGVLRFASEIKALAVLGAESAANNAAIFDYLAYGLYDHGPETFFKGIYSLPAAHYAVRKSGGALEIKPYWSIAEAVAAEKAPQSEEDALARLHDLMQDAIRLQMRSDVPIGVNLSSGVDSSTLLHFLKQSLKGPVHAFSSCLDDETYDECRLIRRTIEPEQKLLWHTATLSHDAVFALADELLAIQDQPYGGMHTMQYFNLYRVQHGMPVTVLLEGQGMDEILGGYGHYAPERRGDFIRAHTNPSVGIEYLAPEFRDAMERGRKPSLVQPFTTDLQNAQFIDLAYRKLPRTLRFNDHISMAFSKELRVPYLDRRLVSFCLALPEEYKIKNGVQKYLLRTLIRERIPHAMREKDKVEFPAFQTKWFREYFREPVFEIINSPSFRSRPYWNHGRLVERVNRFFAGEGSHSFFLWQMIDLEMWLRRFVDQQPAVNN